MDPGLLVSRIGTVTHMVSPCGVAVWTGGAVGWRGVGSGMCVCVCRVVLGCGRSVPVWPLCPCVGLARLLVCSPAGVSVSGATGAGAFV